MNQTPLSGRVASAGYLQARRAFGARTGLTWVKGACGENPQTGPMFDDVDALADIMAPQPRALAQTHIQLKALRQCALRGQDEISRDYLIVSENALRGLKEIAGESDMTPSELVGHRRRSATGQSVIRHSPLRAGLLSSSHHLYSGGRRWAMHPGERASQGHGCEGVDQRVVFEIRASLRGPDRPHRDLQCRSNYKLDQRLARWILMAHDRLGVDTLPLTHEFLSLMLGVRRAGVTEALQALEGQGLIGCARGQVVVRDRKGIERSAGGSYGVPEAEFRRLIG
jgi:hypothetical protein